MTGGVLGAFRALTVACVPAAAGFDEAAWARAEAIVDDALAQRPAGIRRQVLLFVRLLGLLAILRHGRGLARLDPARTRRLLEWLGRSPVLLLRRGTWGVRTLCFMGVYTQAEVRGDIGYAAALRGWEGRGTSPGPWPERRGAAPPEHPDA
ncbi:MAG: hypothetical protein ACYC6F_15540 [Longimicrobiales bacterium]